MAELLPFAKTMRTNQTEAEKIIWSLLRRKISGFKFKRQQPIDPYIVDFICFEKRLIIEIDGGQHTDQKNQERTNYLNKKGFQILRFWNNEVLQNKEGIFQAIEIALNTPLSGSLPQGERGKV